LTDTGLRLWSAAMPINPPENEKPCEDQTGAAKKPDARDNGKPKAKSAKREARLAEALRDNLRRRKQGAKEAP